MKLTFDIDGRTIEFTQPRFIGRCTLRTGSETEVLAPPTHAFTDFAMKWTRKWQLVIDGREVVIEDECQMLYPGAFIHGAVRPHRWKVFVDGKLVREQVGR